MPFFRRLIVLAGLLLVATLPALLPSEAPVASDPPGPDPRPSTWAATQRLYPHWQADSDVYVEAIKTARQLRAASKNPLFGGWTLAGPTNIGGRVVDLAFDPHDSTVVYAAAATGGVLKSVDTGVTWTPIFDDQAILTIGDIAVDPVNPGIVYVGTGEANGGHNNFAGGGLYKSTDGGQTWSFSGLAETVSIARILIDPTNSDRVLVAAVGSYFRANPERGVYLSEDAGTTWERILYTTDTAGVIDLVMHPENPDVLFAALWDRERRHNVSHLSGPESGIFRSRDGGETWERLGAEHGLPEEGVTEHPSAGRIGLTLNRSQADVLYALYTDGQNPFALFKTEDGGDTWTDVDPDDDVVRGSAGFSWYFGQVRSHPDDPDLVFALDVALMRSADSGTSWDYTYGAAGEAHVDYHALAVHPRNPDLIIVGHDGGISRSEDRGLTWHGVEALPLTQFYEIAINPHNPHLLYGGTQDNGVIRSRTGGLDDWERILGGDGFYTIIDPIDEQIIYAESQLGVLQKSADGGRNWVSITNGLPTDRTNWSTPVVMDPNDNRVLYYGADRLYRSDNAGWTWSPVSDELAKDYIPAMGFGTVTAIAVAPSDSNVIYAGTDDGNVWVSIDYAATWTLVTDGLPDRWVTRLAVDPRDPFSAYVTYSGLKWRDPQPHIFHTTNTGASWTDVSGNLPDAPINALALDPIDPDVVYVGTDVGAYVSLDGGSIWEVLGSGLPGVSVYDLKVDPVSHTLVAGTHGRSMYTLDVSGVADVAAEPDVPAERGIVLDPAYPNPFENGTMLRMQFPESGSARLDVYDVRGRRIRVLFEGTVDRGTRSVWWDGTDAAGAPVANGTYLIRLVQDAFIQDQSVVRVRNQ